MTVPALPANTIRATIAVEWENVQLADKARCWEMLGRLSRQIDEVYAAEPGRGAFELLLLYDNHEVGEAAVRANVEKYFAADAPACQLRFVAAPGLNYYEQKNRGAELARGEIVVYIDSDVIPEERLARKPAHAARGSAHTDRLRQLLSRRGGALLEGLCAVLVLSATRGQRHVAAAILVFRQ